MSTSVTLDLHSWISSKLESQLLHHLARKKSILLLGPRQTGKTSLLNRVPSDLTVSFLLARERQKYEKDPALFTNEIMEFVQQSKKKLPLIIVDEVQKIPAVMNEVQYLVDKKIAQFILTGSSARKLKMNTDVNLLPGRVVLLRLDPISSIEYPELKIEQAISDGTLPAMLLEKNVHDRQADLQTYVETYLEDEIRKESVVRNLAHFSRFLEWACLESGKLVSYRSISQEIGIAHTTVSGYYQILEDRLIAERIDPLTNSTTRKKLVKSSRYLIFDLGVRRLGANEATDVHPKRKGEWFEQWVGLELIRASRWEKDRFEVCFWTDPNGPKVDYVIKKNRRYIPIEVKWSASPQPSDAKHIETFISEYPEAKDGGFVVCRTERRFRLSKNVVAIPWQELFQVLE